MVRLKKSFIGWRRSGSANGWGIVQISHKGSYGAYRVASGEGNNFLIQNIQWTAGHKYYLFGYAISMTPQIFACNVTNRGSKFVVTTNPDYYVKGGSIYSAASTEINSISVCYAATTDNVNVDCIGLVDLTVAFGAGNEPDVHWCNSKIDYFEGNRTVYK